MIVKFRTKGVPGSVEPGRFSQESILDIVRNVFYVGYVAHYPTPPLSMVDDLENPDRIKQTVKNRRIPEKIYPGKHDPLYPFELWEKNLYIRKSKQRTPTNAGNSDRVYLLSGIAQCWECQRFVKSDRTVSLRGSTNGSGKQIYRCASLHGRARDKQAKLHDTPHDLVHKPDTKAPDIKALHKLPNLPATLLEPQVDALIKNIVLPEDWHERILASVYSNEGMSEYYSQRYNLLQELQTCRDLYQDKLIDSAEMKSRSMRIASELNRLTPKADPRSRELLPLLSDFSALWDQMSPLQKRGLLNVIFEGLYFDGEGKLREARARSPFDRIMGLEQEITA